METIFALKCSDCIDLFNQLFPPLIITWLLVCPLSSLQEREPFFIISNLFAIDQFLVNLWL